MLFNVLYKYTLCQSLMEIEFVWSFLVLCFFQLMNYWLVRNFYFSFKFRILQLNFIYYCIYFIFWFWILFLCCVYYISLLLAVFSLGTVLIGLDILRLNSLVVYDPFFLARLWVIGHLIIIFENGTKINCWVKNVHVNI